MHITDILSFMCTVSDMSCVDLYPLDLEHDLLFCIFLLSAVTIAGRFPMVGSSTRSRSLSSNHHSSGY